ncbi:hypothetical protein NONO_c47200 [Nocardia nova SH22a]|uniref:Secreted protein n=1 Tax=Nocardia nova SH22a TaxID=1415166 RepID=W5TK17_9NOCA|nr:hypothetical protein [Nocardia nova]AHH19504.1 hypothetical protein NONO_c47200 [Nocardia nova SH22a]
MMTGRKFRRPALVSTALLALGVAAVSAAGPALAANTIDIKGVGPANVGVDYTCDADSGTTAVKVMVGDPDADAPSATGAQPQITCDGQPQNTVVVLTGPDGAPAQLSQGQTVQVRVALVDAKDIVVSGKANIFKLG